MEVKLAEALLRRKELQEKVDQIRHIKKDDIFKMVVQRRQINETIDDIQAQVPKLELNQVTAEYDHYAKQLRLVDAAIQQANWTTSIPVTENVMSNYEAKPTA
jgi:uncharacterized protein YhaN